MSLFEEMDERVPNKFKVGKEHPLRMVQIACLIRNLDSEHLDNLNAAGIKMKLKDEAPDAAMLVEQYGILKELVKLGD